MEGKIVPMNALKACRGVEVRLHLMKRRLGGPKGRSGQFEDEINWQLLAGDEIVAQSLYQLSQPSPNQDLGLAKLHKQKKKKRRRRKRKIKRKEKGKEEVKKEKKKKRNRKRRRKRKGKEKGKKKEKK